jgi:hypothetical protein
MGFETILKSLQLQVYEKSQKAILLQRIFINLFRKIDHFYRTRHQG